MNFYKYIFLYFFLLFFSLASFSQGYKKNRIGYIVDAGFATYIGDLSKNVQSLTFQPNLGIGVSYKLSNAFALRGEVNCFKLKGIQENIASKIQFHSNDAELAAVLTYDIIPNERSFAHRKKITPYLFAGIGATLFKSKVERSGNTGNYRSINESTYTGTTPIIPFGAGLRVKIAASTDLVFEAGYRKTFTKNLDNISPQYKTDANGEVKAGANPGSCDSYFFSNVKLVFSPKDLFKKKNKTATPQSKTVSQKGKETSRKISRNKGLATDRKVKLLVSK